MFDQAISSIKIFISIIVVGITSILGFQNNTPPPSPSPTPFEIPVKQPPTSTPSAIPSIVPVIKPKSSPTPSPSPEIDMDLNLERAMFFPEKRSENDFDSLRQMEAGLSKLFFRQSNKLDSINIGMRNNGHEKAIKTVINIIVDGESIFQRTIDLIEKQSIKYERVDIDFPSKFGKHRMEIQINPGKLFPEKQFDNNSRVYEYEYLD